MTSAPVPNWQVRLLEETQRTDAALKKLLSFLVEVEDPQIPTNVSADELALLEIQAQCMGAYLRALRERCRRSGLAVPVS